MNLGAEACALVQAGVDQYRWLVAGFPTKPPYLPCLTESTVGPTSYLFRRARVKSSCDHTTRAHTSMTSLCFRQSPSLSDEAIVKAPPPICQDTSQNPQIPPHLDASTGHPSRLQVPSHLWSIATATTSSPSLTWPYLDVWEKLVSAGPG